MVFCFPSKFSNTSIDTARAIIAKHPNFAVNLNIDETRPVIGKAFAGKTIETCEPLMASVMKTMGDDLSNRERQELAGMMLGFPSYETLQQGGLALGIRRETNGALGCVIIFREYDPAKESRRPTIFHKILNTITDISAYYHMKFDSLGLPKILEDSSKKKLFEKACSSWEQILGKMHRWHLTYAPQQKHWYVVFVAVDPDAQGNGYGKKMMDLMGEIADETNMQCYLESPSYNRTFYEKCGYEHIQDTDLSFSNETEEKPLAFCIMTRNPKFASPE